MANQAEVTMLLASLSLGPNFNLPAADVADVVAPAPLPAHAPLPLPLPDQAQTNRLVDLHKKRKRFENLMHWKWEEVINLDDEDEIQPESSSARSAKRRRTHPVSLFGNKRVTCFNHNINRDDA